MTNYKKSKSDFLKDLQNLVYLLQIDCDTYDSGREYVSPSLAAKLRVLLKDKGKSNVSLLTHLEIKDMKFLNTANTINERNILPSEPLTFMGPDEDFKFMKSYPTLDRYFLDDPTKKWIPFEEWWDQTIYKNGDFKLSRQDLIEHLADKDGGAHIDGKISNDYYDFSRRGGGATTTHVVKSDVDDSPGETIYESAPQPVDNIHFAALRQITFEVLESINFNGI